MMFLDLRPFDIVEGVNYLFLLPILSRIPTVSGIPILSRISKFSGIRPDLEEISCSGPDISGSRTPLCNFYIFHKIKRHLHG